MSDKPVETPGTESAATPATPAPTTGKRIRRTMLSTGFSTVPGKTCEVCGFKGFRWQTECPEGHPLT